ncbi:SUR7/PalI family-domain-containing protein [Biscogniauxia marginata]|nr:SUR7/PalI family-domain-containing protein [Biscogniauxia marginata]
MGAGRFVCVALPFILTVGSIICGLIAGLTGVTNTNLYLFRIDLTDLSVNVGQLQALVSSANDIINSRSADPYDWSEAASDADSVSDAASAIENANSTAITAADVGLANTYDFNLWGYCITPQNGSRNCTKAKYNWAEEALNTDWVENFTNVAGLNITIPDEINDGLTLFKTISRWTEIVYVISMVLLGLELVVGLFSVCSRAVSCLTWLVSGFATAAVIAAAVMMTVMGSVVVGAIEGAASQYGVDGSLNNSFLATIWIGAAFALGASLFWLFSACCCKADHRSSHKRGGSETEKFLPTGSYAPLGESNAHNSGYNNGAPKRGGARSDLAYEPYSHSRV